MVTIRLDTLIAAPVQRCFDLSLSIETHLAGQTRSRERAVGGVTSGVMRLGEVVRWDRRIGSPARTAAGAVTPSVTERRSLTR